MEGMDTSSLNTTGIEQNMENNVEIPGVSTQSTDLLTNSSSPTQSPMPTEPVSNGQPSPQEIHDWMKDKRYKKMWNNPNDVYKSVLESEKFINTKYEPLKNQHEKLSKTFKTYNIEPEKIEDYIKEYTELKNPDHPKNKTYDYLTGLINDPVYGSKIEAFFQEIENQRIKDLYPGLTEREIELTKKQQETEERLNQYEQQKQMETLTQHAFSETEKGLKQVTDKASKIGIQFNDEMKNRLLSYCMDNNVDPKYIPYVFNELFAEEIEKSIHQNTEKRILANLNKNKDSVILGANSVSHNKYSNSKEEAEKALKRAFTG